MNNTDKCVFCGEVIRGRANIEYHYMYECEDAEVIKCNICDCLIYKTTCHANKDTIEQQVGYELTLYDKHYNECLENTVIDLSNEVKNLKEIIQNIKRCI